MSQNPSCPHPLLLTNSVDAPLNGLGKQDLRMRRAAAQLIAETPDAVPHTQKLPQFSFLPCSDGWRDILMEDSFVFRAIESANVRSGLAPNGLPLPFQRKTPFKGG